MVNATTNLQKEFAAALADRSGIVFTIAVVRMA